MEKEEIELASDKSASDIEITVKNFWTSALMLIRLYSAAAKV